MRRLWVVALGLSLAGCSESYAPTAATPIHTLPPASAADPAGPGAESTGTAQTANYGIDDVPDTRSKAVKLSVRNRDEINSKTDWDWYQVTNNGSPTQPPNSWFKGSPANSCLSVAPSI